MIFIHKFFDEVVIALFNRKKTHIGFRIRARPYRNDLNSCNYRFILNYFLIGGLLYVIN